MKKVTKHKIGMPAWLRDLINKGKYQVTNRKPLLNPGNFIFINNHKIKICKFSEKLSSNNLIGLKDFHKVINNKKYLFDVKKGLIFIETNND